MRSPFIILKLLPALVFSSCMTVGPDYDKPALGMPNAWTSSISKDQSQPMSSAQLWWKKFNDPTLTSLINKAREANPNLKIAYHRITEGWHQRHVLSSAWHPKANIFAEDRYGILDYNRSKVDLNLGDSQESNAEFQVGWELDFFGRVKRIVEASEAEYQSKVEGMRDIHVFIYSEVALSYVAYRTLEERVKVAKKSVSLFKKVAQSIESLEKEGIGSKLEFHEATARVYSNQAELTKLYSEKQVALNKLASLIGKQPKDISSLLNKNKRIPKAPRNIATTSVWLHYRGLVVLALAFFGNAFCAACPLMLTRGISKRIDKLVNHKFRFPKALKNKYLVIVLMLLYFFSYEFFD